MKLFYSPNACSMAIHIILEEIGKPYELALVNFAEAAQYKPEYLAVNPKSKVPALMRDDGTVLTELPAIAWYLAKTNPQANLLPNDIESEARVLELLEYMTATVHMRGYTRIFRTATFTPSPADEPKVVEAGRNMVIHGLQILEPVLGDKDYLLGQYSIADCGFFYIVYWASRRANIPLSPALQAYLDRLLARPAVARMLASEGLR
ncbi:MAG: glutathione S-transferase N-terminal domain-containing protein [Acidocella sp.]|nr:glutathione S-transferase N-terminal domain-containing protein [Acidocella sp.]